MAEEQAAKLAIIRTADYSETYANNLHFENSAWDLKLLLGRLDQSDPMHQVTRQFLGVSLPWMQVKLMVHHLQVQLAIHEIQNGKVTIRPDLLPRLPQVTEEQLKDPVFKASVEKVDALHREFIASL